LVEPPNPMATATGLGEPPVARPCCDADGSATGRGDQELPRDDACDGEAPDLVRSLLGEPEIAIGPCCDAGGPATGRGDGELGDDPVGGGAAADLVQMV